MQQRVVVIGHGYTSRLGVIRSVAQAGCYVIVVVLTVRKRNGELDTTKPVDCYSRCVKEIYYCHKKDEQGLIHVLLDHCVDENQKTIIIPDSDFSASVVDRHQGLLEDSFVFPHIHHKEGEVCRWMDKGLQKDLARSLGMNVAGGRVVAISDGDYTLPVDIRYPCFPKPLVTLKGDKYMRRCDRESELRTVIEHLGKMGAGKVLVEDFIQIEEEYAVLGFSDGVSVCIPGIICFLRPSKSHFGLALQGRVTSAEGFEPLIEQFKTFVLSVGYVGLFDIDFFLSGGLYYFGEMNLRFGGSGYAVTKMGVNLPAMMVSALSGQDKGDLQMEIPRRAEAVFVNERMSLDDWYQGYITTKEFLRLETSADISFIRDEQDPGPQQVFEKCFAARRLRRVIRNIVKPLHKK